MTKPTEQHPALRFLNLRLRTVTVIKNTNKLYVEWKNGEEAVVDFTESIQTAKGFKPLKDPKIFKKACVGSWGSSIEWPEDIDFGSDTLRQMAEEQGAVFLRKVG